ncbi:unnamed protein product [Gongylonema pulchrum]|uniref:Uncharacterized protein n=1 Tax=Gongylonema pulchrum TaxID=637853 RepID=A0A3P6T4F8_9BILA|nr:unnamed protein product [Gongylonema pulchrum]
MYIPEVRFGDVHSMDPVILSDVPLERFAFSAVVGKLAPFLPLFPGVSAHLVRTELRQR